MAKDVNAAVLGTDKVRWDLTPFYSGAEDVRIGADVAMLVADMERFEKMYRGQLAHRLGEALQDYCDLTKRMSKVQMYFFLSLSRDTTDTVMRRESSKTSEALAKAGAKLAFLELEIGKLKDAELKALLAHPAVAHHKPWIDQLRKMAVYHLDEAVEQALTLRAPYGAGEWSDMVDELDAALRFEFEGQVLNLTEIINIVTEDRDSDRRARALETANKGLATQKHTYFVARALNALVGDRLADDDMRGFEHPMQAVNMGNMVDDATVEALHDAVNGRGVELMQRFYKLKARLLGLKALRWSDRNAPMPFAPEKIYNWKESCQIVKKAYREFSPTLGGLVDTVLDPAQGWVDAPPMPEKTSGAFDYSVMLPEGVRSYMMLNNMGTPGDVMTLAHELGHAVHGMLAAEAQGPIMWHAPIPYAETASIFGEMLTFESLMRQTDGKTERLALYMDKMNESFNAVVRQIQYSEFEKIIYARRRSGKISAEEFDATWVELTKRFYGDDGKVFIYGDDFSHMWSYISHFHSYRFYVYGYAFGELFTQSLMATRDRVGEAFEPLYLELLRAGGTKDAVQLLAPFGLNPREADFWDKGIESSFGVWLAEAETLADELGF